MVSLANPVQWILGFILILSSIGVISARKPVYSALSFLLTLLTLATYYLQFSTEFIAVIQILVYAGAILVIFMFVIILFQDAHQQLSQTKPKSNSFFLYFSLIAFLLSLVFIGLQFIGISSELREMNTTFGTAQSLGKTLYIDFFFPFEAVILLFLIAIVGALYIGRKEQT